VGSTALLIIGRDRIDLLGNHGGLYYALPRERKMFSPLDSLSPALGGHCCVVLAELHSGHGDRAALLSAVEQSDAAWVLGHSSNCC
jgi:hypothetical protein